MASADGVHSIRIQPAHHANQSAAGSWIGTQTRQIRHGYVTQNQHVDGSRLVGILLKNLPPSMMLASNVSSKDGGCVATEFGFPPRYSRQLGNRMQIMFRGDE